MPKFVISTATAGALVLLCALAVVCAVATPDVVPTTAAETVFSAERAMVHVRAMAQRPHPGGSRDHVRVRVYIMSQLGQMGIDPEHQETTGIGTRYAAAGHVGNIIGVLPGGGGGAEPGNRSSAVLLMAHYDGVPAGPAAGDDASGSAVLLEVARALRAGPPLRHDVIFLWTDGEESGLLGAAAFVREHPLASHVDVIMNFEARGTRGPSFMFETGPGNLDVTRVLRRVGGARATSLSTAVYRQLPNDTDLSEMAVLAKPAMNFAFIGGQERYHTSEDDVEHLDPRSVQHHGDQALALAREFATEPLPRPVTGDAVFFDVPALGLIVYPESWATALAVLALALAVIAVARLRRAEPSPSRWLRDTAYGAAGMMVAALLAAGMGVAVIEAVRRLHVAIGSGSPAWSGLYLGAIAVLAFAVAAAVYAVTRLVATPRGAHTGAVLVWAIVSLVVALIVPGVSFLFTWPALFGVSTALVASLVSRRAIIRLDAWTAALVTVFLLVPTLYLTAGVGLGLAAMSAVLVCLFTACGAWLLAPLLEDLESARRWYAPAGFAMVGFLLIGAGAATVRHDADHPTRASLVYAFDADSAAAWLTGSSGSAVGREYIRAVVGGLTPATDSVRSAPAAWLPASWVAAGIAPAPLARVPAPATEVVRSVAGAQSRLVALRVRAAPGTLGVTMSMDSAAVGAVAINGRPVDRSRYRRPGGRRWSLDFVAPPDSGFLLELTLTSPGPAELTLLARTSGLPAIPELAVPERPAGVLPSQNGDVSLVYKRVRL